MSFYWQPHLHFFFLVYSCFTHIRSVHRLLTIGRSFFWVGCCWTTGTFAQSPTCDFQIITDPPSSSAICTRGIVSLSVGITGSQSVTYQWFRGAVPINNSGTVNGATSAVLTLSDIQTVQAGQYRVVVSASCKSLTSTACNLSVTTPTHPDYNALADLFYSTGGLKWTNRSQWLTNCDPCSGWLGVTCSQGRSTTLTLSSNNLEGTLPTNLGNLSALKRMEISYNWYLGGSIPASISNLSNLEFLSLKSNGLTGVIPASIGGMTRLNTLILSGNSLTNGIPSSFGGLVNLSGLDLSINPLAGSIPTSLSALSNLACLSLSDNQLQGIIPSWLGRLQQLQGLNLTNNAFTGTIPTSFSALSALQKLELEKNSLTGTLPEFLSDLSNLCVLSVGSNQFSGQIPRRIASLTNLVFLLLNNNQLTGTIPNNLGRLDKLAHLALNHNQLSGSLPDSLGKLKSLIYLQLQKNLLTGSIPNQFRDMQQLYELNMRNNQLEGSIPNSIGALAGLQVLRLDTNRLSGCIPSSLSILCGRHVAIGQNAGLPNNGNWTAFCASGAGSYNGTLTTTQSGYWHNKAIWSCGRVPQLGDRAVVQHPVRFAPETVNQSGSIQFEGAGKLFYESSGRIHLKY